MEVGDRRMADPMPLPVVVDRCGDRLVLARYALGEELTDALVARE